MSSRRPLLYPSATDEVSAAAAASAAAASAAASAAAAQPAAATLDEVSAADVPSRFFATSLDQDEYLSSSAAPSAESIPTHISETLSSAQQSSGHTAYILPGQRDLRGRFFDGLHAQANRRFRLDEPITPEMVENIEAEEIQSKERVKEATKALRDAENTAAEVTAALREIYARYPSMHPDHRKRASAEEEQQQEQRRRDAEEIVRIQQRRRVEDEERRTKAEQKRREEEEKWTIFRQIKKNTGIISEVFNKLEADIDVFPYLDRDLNGWLSDIIKICEKKSSFKEAYLMFFNLLSMGLRTALERCYNDDDDRDSIVTEVSRIILETKELDIPLLKIRGRTNAFDLIEAIATYHDSRQVSIRDHLQFLSDNIFSRITFDQLCSSYNLRHFDGDINFEEHPIQLLCIFSSFGCPFDSYIAILLYRLESARGYNNQALYSLFIDSLRPLHMIVDLVKAES